MEETVPVPYRKLKELQEGPLYSKDIILEFLLCLTEAEAVCQQETSDSKQGELEFLFASSSLYGDLLIRVQKVDKKLFLLVLSSGIIYQSATSFLKRPRNGTTAQLPLKDHGLFLFACLCFRC